MDCYGGLLDVIWLLDATAPVLFQIGEMMKGTPRRNLNLRSVGGPRTASVKPVARSRFLRRGKK
jgi:hypothetical protein